MSKYTAEQVLEVSTALHRAAHSNGARTSEAVKMLDYLAELLRERTDSEAVAPMLSSNDLHQHLLDLLGAKDHEDAARIIAELHARELQATQVKPLVWSEYYCGGQEDIPSWRGENPLGLFIDVSFAGKYRLKRHSDAPEEELVKAKAKAQKEYEAKVRSAFLYTDPPAAQAMPDRQGCTGKTWQHAANEWADAATNGLQLLANVLEGISTAEEAFALLKADIEHAREETPSIFKPESADSDRRDAERIDWLEKFIDSDPHGMLLLHHGAGENRGITGLGVRNTGRSLRQAIDAAMSAGGES